MAASHPLPVLRWVALLFLAVYLPTYGIAYGLVNFVFLCNLSVLLLVPGLALPSPLLVSSQALSALLIDSLWTLDLGSRLIAGRHLIGGTEYMWDSRWPLFARLLSLYHVLLPPTLLWSLRRLGYDRRALVLQSAIGTLAVIGGRLLGTPEANINYAYVAPFFGRALGPAPLHLAAIVGALLLVMYPATHLLLARVFEAKRLDSGGGGS